MTGADIEGIPLFAGLSPDELARVVPVTRRLQLSVGQVVVNEGEFAFDFYAIKHGAAEVRRGGEHVADLGTGDVFGELGVVPDAAHRWTRRRDASVIVTEATDAIAIDGTDFRRLTEEIPALGEAVHAVAALRSHQ